MALYIAFTDEDWIARQRAHYAGGLTDWWTKPSGTRFRGAARGDTFCIKPLRSRDIIGWATVVERTVDPASSVWDRLPRDNGAYSSWQERARNTANANHPDPVVASIILDDLVFLPDGGVLELPANLKLAGMQQGKRYEEDDPAIAYLMARINEGVAVAPPDAGSGRARRRAAESLLLDAYVRRNSGGVRVIAPLHNRLAVRFVEWLRGAGYQEVEYERDHVDVRFRREDQSFFAESRGCAESSACRCSWRTPVGDRRLPSSAAPEFHRTLLV